MPETIELHITHNGVTGSFTSTRWLGAFASGPYRDMRRALMQQAAQNIETETVVLYINGHSYGTCDGNLVATLQVALPEI